MSANYCRREKAGKPCGAPIRRANPLDWCDGCRERLPFWPTLDKLDEAARLPQEPSIYGTGEIVPSNAPRLESPVLGLWPDEKRKGVDVLGYWPSPSLFEAPR